MANTSTLGSTSVPPRAGEGPDEDAETRDGGSTRGESAPERGGNESGPISKDVTFDILRNGRRRQVLRYLEENPATTLSDLAEHVAAVENDKPVDRITSDERKCVYVGLYQCHLPRMSDAGVIDYDRARGTIELHDRADQLLAYLDLDPSRRRVAPGPWRRRLDGLVAALASKLGR